MLAPFTVPHDFPLHDLWPLLTAPPLEQPEPKPVRTIPPPTDQWDDECDPDA